MLRWTAALLLAALALPLSAEAEEAVTAAVRWSDALFSLEVSRPLEPADAGVVRAKDAAREAIESRLGVLLAGAIAPLPVDSSRTAGELLRDDPGFFEHLLGLARSTPPTAVFLSPELDRLIERWLFPLFRGVASTLIPERAVPLLPVLGHVASRAFTGVVIWARGQLPVVGKGGTAFLEPALFPRIWDANMNPVLERGNCQPDSLRAWGMVGYVGDLDDPAVAARAGSDPLRIAARALFGKIPVDVVIPVEAARQLLSVAENVRVLSEGRVVIVFGK